MCTKSFYKESGFIVCTSNLCERLFSKAGFTLNDRREAISAKNFKSHLFLHANSHLWDIKDVHRMITGHE